MTERVPRRRITLVDLAGDDAADVSQCEEDAEGGGAFAVRGAVCREPGYVAAGAEKTCGCDQIGCKVLGPGAGGGQEYRVSGDAKWRGENEWEEASLVAV